MFTGIIEAIGTIQAINITGQGARLVISTGTLDMSDVKLGDSIANNGICLTVVAFDSSSFSADVSNETLTRTGFVNLLRVLVGIWSLVMLMRWSQLVQWNIMAIVLNTG